MGTLARVGSESESSMNSVQIGQKSYEMPPRDGFTVAYFLTVADIDRSARFYETVFGGRILSGGDSNAHCQRRGRADPRKAVDNAPRPRPGIHVWLTLGPDGMRI